MRKLLSLLIVAGLAGGGWYFSQHYQIRGLDNLKLARRSRRRRLRAQPAAHRTPDGQVRIASFNIQVFGEKKVADPRVPELAGRGRAADSIWFHARDSLEARNPAAVCRRHQRHGQALRLCSRQATRAKPQRRRNSMPSFSIRPASRWISSALYTVSDPDDLLHREPFVGWFRVRGPPPSRLLRSRWSTSTPTPTKRGAS